MKKETYMKMTSVVKRSRCLERMITIADSVITSLVYMIYPAFIVLLALNREPELLRAVIVPGISFIAVSVFRKIYNAPRPYEVFGAEPVIKKDTKGKSMPSRHVFSVFVIAAVIFHFYHDAGIAVAAAGMILAVVRVAGGVHFVRDVAAGAAVGIIAGLAGFMI